MSTDALETPTIGLKLIDDKLMYKDNEGNSGPAISTTVDEGGAVVWKLKADSGITKIKKIKFTEDIFEIKPTPNRKKTVWVAVLKDGLPPEQEYEYEVKTKPKASKNIKLEGSGSLSNLKIKPPSM